MPSRKSNAGLLALLGLLRRRRAHADVLAGVEHALRQPPLLVLDLLEPLVRLALAGSLACYTVSNLLRGNDNSSTSEGDVPWN